MGGGHRRGNGGSKRSSHQTVRHPADQQQQPSRLQQPQQPLEQPSEQHPSHPQPPRTHMRPTMEQLCPNPRATLLPIAFADGKVTVGDGLVLMDRVSPQARVQHRDSAAAAATDMVLLSMAASKGATAIEDFALGTLRCKQWLACARNKLWWMTPEWGKTARELPPETQFLLAELEDGTYATILPLISQQKFRGTLRPPKKGTPEHVDNVLTLRMESGDVTVGTDYFDGAVLLAAGREPYALVEAAVTAAAALSGGARPLREKKLPPNLDVFGWCSWDSFYSAVSATGLADAVQSLTSGGTPPRWVVIDDGWQCTEVDEPYRDIPTEQLKQQITKEKTAVKAGDAALREAYLEGEMEALGQAAKEIPAGTAMGAYLQEIRASGPPEEGALSGVDYHSLARQHVVTDSMEDLALAPTKRMPLVIRATSTLFQYAVGLVFGAFQALVVLFYQWVVDPAEHGTWPVNLFTYLTTGPLKGSMLQFFADSTNFTRRLTDIRANAKFSSPYATAEDISSGRREDLKSVVDHLRKRFNVQYVYCWHGLSAYWSGVSPNSPSMSQYDPKLYFPKPTPGLSEIEPSTAWNPGMLAGLAIADRPAALFNDMHAYLAEAGINGVKVDCQAGVGLVGSRMGGGPAAALRAHDALEDSIAANFADNHAINCMCHSTENIYRWRDTAVARASDDFYPTDKASHIPHLAACAFNGLFLSPLALPDWDMFSSRHVAADIHAVARAVSGGPVYVSDAPGSHSFEVLRKLVLPDGSVLRALLPGRPTRDSLFADVLRDGVSLLKIWNLNAVTGVVGVFNLQGSSWDRTRRRFHIHNTAPPELTTVVRPTDVEIFRHRLEAAGCDVAGALAAARAEEEEEAAQQAQRSSGRRTPSKRAPPARRSGNGNGSSGSSGGSGLSSGDGGRSARSAPGWTASGASFMSTAGAAGPAGLTEDEEASPAPAVHDFAAYVGDSDKLHRVPWDKGVTVSMKGWHSTVVTLAPIARYEFGGSSSAGVEFAPLGLTNMLNGGGAVLRVHAEHAGPATEASAAGPEEEDGCSSGQAEQLLVHLSVRGRGTLLAYCSHKPQACTVDGFDVPFTHKGDRLTVEVPQVGSLHAGRSEQDCVISF